VREGGCGKGENMVGWRLKMVLGSVRLTFGIYHAIIALVEGSFFLYDYRL